MILRPFLPFVLACACALAGCATGSNPRDPYENFNRNVFKFNEGLDRVVVKPIAKGYDKIMPDLAQEGVTNFFNNLGMVVTTFNDAAQLKLDKVPVDFLRFATNLTFGVFGLFDVASELKVEYRHEDFGQSLGYWGVGSGPYIVLPLLGPSTVRDGSGLVVDFVVSPYYYWEDKAAIRWGLVGVNIVNARANLLTAEKILTETGVERYSFLRDVYLQRREYLIHDGIPPADPGKTGPREKTLLELEKEDMQDEPPTPTRLPTKKKKEEKP